MASLLCECSDSGVEMDRARIIDFFLCFPHELLTTRIPVSYSKNLRRLLKSLPQAYENPYSTRQAFSQLRRVQSQVAMDMVGKDILVKQAYREGLLISEPNSRVQNTLMEVAQNWKSTDTEWHQHALQMLLEVDLSGRDGLKDRTGLMEYRYDF